MTMERYVKIWYKMALASFQVFFSSRISTVLFLSGKTMRFLFFLGFLIYLTQKTKIFANYNLYEIVLFYLTFSFLDSAIQTLFKEVSKFRAYILDGSFDMLLLKPINSLFRSLFGATDLLDFVTLFPFVIGIGYTFFRIGNISLLGILLYILLIINSIVIAAAFHIGVLALGVVSTEVDNTIMLYRDITGMGKLPVDIYREPIRGLITFVVPVGIMMTVPVKAVLGLVTLPLILFSFFFSFFLLSISIFCWNTALKHYTSASS